MLATNKKMGFLHRVNIFSSAFDERCRKYDVYNVIFTAPEMGGNLPSGGWFMQISPSCQLNVTSFLLHCH